MTQTVIQFQPHLYWRTRYTMPQPPGYIYPIYCSTLLFERVSAELDNTRVFNWFLNLEPIITSLLLAASIGLLVTKESDARAGSIAAIAYWMSPLVILNSPIQGYRDPMVALLGTLSVIAAYRRQPELAVCSLVFAFMTKPQGVLVAPVILWVSVLEHTWQRIVKSLFIGVIAGLIICFPFVISGRFLGMVQGVLSIAETSGDLSRQSLNLWWPMQYFANVCEMHREGNDWTTGLLGSDVRVFSDYPIWKFGKLTGTHPFRAGFFVFGVFTIFNLWITRRLLQCDRRLIFLTAAVQVYGYFMLRPGAQINHYFLMVPLFTVAWAFRLIPTSWAVLLTSILLAQDLIFYGFGRDCDFGKDLLAAASMGWITNVLAVINVFLFFRSLWQCWKYQTALTRKAINL